MNNPFALSAVPGLGPVVDGMAIAPEITLWTFACIALLIEWLRPASARRGSTGYEVLSAESAALIGLAIAFLLVLAEGLERIHPAFTGNIVMDPLAWYFKGACILTSLILIPSSWSYMQGRANRAEFYGLLLLATSGMALMVESNDLIMLFLAIEFLSITSYVLVGYLKGSRRSIEASVKYFLFGAICSSLMLYGMSLLYGFTGSTNFQTIQQNLVENPSGVPAGIFVFMLVTFFAGIGFKISMWPFHMWAPDAYEGAPTPITAFLSVGPKLAGIAVFLRTVQTIFRSEGDWPIVLGIAAIITMTWGNLAALSQSNIKRMLAYSSIAQAGYLLVGVVSLSVLPSVGGETLSSNPGMLNYVLSYAGPGVLIYSGAYLIMNLGAFIVAIEVERRSGTSDLSGFTGLGDTRPLMAAAMTIFLLGLGGIPLTAGFIGKLYLFGSAVLGAAYGAYAPLLWALAAFGVANSVISVYYYFRVVQPIWLQPGAGRDPQPLNPPETVAVILALATLGLGIFGQGLVAPGTQLQHVWTLTAEPAAALVSSPTPQASSARGPAASGAAIGTPVGGGSAVAGTPAASPGASSSSRPGAAPAAPTPGAGHSPGRAPGGGPAGSTP